VKEGIMDVEKGKLVEIIKKEKEGVLAGLLQIENSIASGDSKIDLLTEGIRVQGASALGVAMYHQFVCRMWCLKSELRELCSKLPDTLVNPIAALRSLEEDTRDGVVHSMQPQSVLAEYVIDIVENQPDDPRDDDEILSEAGATLTTLLKAKRELLASQMEQ
jgi:hypothetical protein